jgi:hypothetical protein
MIHGSWIESPVPTQIFDAALYLYSIGLSPSRTARLAELKKIAGLLEPGSPLYVDVMNLNDTAEWGPDLRKAFLEKHLERRGYELGDVFYRRIGAKETSFYHYFREHEAVSLFTEAGFEIAETKYIGCGSRYGELVGPDEGAILFVLERSKPCT